MNDIKVGTDERDNTIVQETVVIRVNISDAEREHWQLSIEFTAREEEVVVQMNVDTIVCMLDGYGFKTYAWPTDAGDVQLAALACAAKYLSYCMNS